MGDPDVRDPAVPDSISYPDRVPRILIVDDDPTVRTRLNSLLRREDATDLVKEGLCV